MKINKNKNGGFIKMIIIIVIAIVVLSYYGFDLKSIFTSDQVQDNLAYVWDIVVKIWDLFIAYIWNPLLNILNLNN